MQPKERLFNPKPSCDYDTSNAVYTHTTVSTSGWVTLTVDHYQLLPIPIHPALYDDFEPLVEEENATS